MLLHRGSYLYLSLLPKYVTGNTHSQVEYHPPKQKDFWGRVTALLSNVKSSSESPSVWSQSFHTSVIEEVLILSTHHSSQSWRHLPKTQIFLKILERHSRSKFLLLSAFRVSFHLYLLLQSSIHLPSSSHTLGIPVSTCQSLTHLSTS